jgi:hypothetical protein
LEGRLNLAAARLERSESVLPWRGRPHSRCRFSRRRLIDLLALPWDDACLRFYETERSVTTPSRWQVRQLIYATSVKRWKRYGNKIQPLIEALGDLTDVWLPSWPCEVVAKAQGESKESASGTLLPSRRTNSVP